MLEKAGNENLLSRWPLVPTAFVLTPSTPFLSATSAVASPNIHLSRNVLLPSSILSQLYPSNYGSDTVLMLEWCCMRHFPNYGMGLGARFLDNA